MAGQALLFFFFGILVKGALSDQSLLHKYGYSEAVNSSQEWNKEGGKIITINRYLFVCLSAQLTAMVAESRSQTQLVTGLQHGASVGSLPRLS